MGKCVAETSLLKTGQFFFKIGPINVLKFFKPGNPRVFPVVFQNDGEPLGGVLEKPPESVCLYVRGFQDNPVKIKEYSSWRPLDRPVFAQRQ